MSKGMYIIAAAVAAAAIWCGGCHKEKEEGPYATPEATVRAYAEAMRSGDFEGALGCYADSALAESSVGVVGLTKEEIRNLFLKSLADSQEPYVKNQPAKLEVKMLTAEVTYDLGDGKHTHTLVNQNGEWKIATDLTSK